MNHSYLLATNFLANLMVITLALGDQSLGESHGDKSFVLGNQSLGESHGDQSHGKDGNNKSFSLGDHTGKDGGDQSFSLGNYTGKDGGDQSFALGDQSLGNQTGDQYLADETDDHVTQTQITQTQQPPQNSTSVVSSQKTSQPQRGCSDLSSLIQTHLKAALKALSLQPTAYRLAR
ncbi:hypothetical protein PGTUg99_006074 [Puccinia graminis f. sp. tritici]|uniref:Uncharacterized protein n=1 Tax=Puccinia graminis f. sp. tritici TaxID=56615 RepID=A0A5B0QYK1_PUCGR|nr:hypothetical protein PGTUg99_006074 [Puccinia graminis f. sp. tritici]